jgi:hypothetical protein
MTTHASVFRHLRHLLINAHTSWRLNELFFRRPITVLLMLRVPINASTPAPCGTRRETGGASSLPQALIPAQDDDLVLERTAQEAAVVQ